MRLRPAAFPAIALAIAACHPRQPDARITVSVVGPSLVVARGVPPPRPAAAALALRSATAIGLLRLDEAGQIVPGLAVRWALIDEGLDGIFRIDLARGVSTRAAAGRLRAALLAPGNRWLAGGIEAVVAVTPTVIDVRLTEPRSDLLTVLALPALATLDPAGGPLRIAERRGDAILLEAASPATGKAPSPQVLLRGERVGRAVARFVSGDAQLVLGGTFADLPVARAAALPPRALRFDRASGLFGLAVADRDSFYAQPTLLEALSLAIDRARIVALTAGPGAAEATTLAGSRYEPSLAERRARAVMLLARTTGGHPPLRLALPPGPGAGLLFRLLEQDWRYLGIAVEMVAGGKADLTLVDIVAPPGERARVACVAAAGCDPRDKRALVAPPYIPIGAPVRWSLVAPDLDLFTENMLAVHPLDRLRIPR